MKASNLRNRNNKPKSGRSQVLPVLAMVVALLLMGLSLWLRWNSGG